MTNVHTGIKLKKKLLKGIQKLSDVVSSTLGPGGRTVLIEDKVNGIRATKDGVTVAKAFTDLEDNVESIGANLVKQVSVKSANETGDGTTTSTLLASNIVEEGLKVITQGVNAVSVKKGIDAATSQVLEYIKNQSREVGGDEHIKQVAFISGNNDEEIGNLISEALKKVGSDGLVSIEESKSGETELEVVEGMQFERGYKSPHFVTNNNSMTAVLEEPVILMYDGKITSANELIPIFQKCNSENRSLLIVAEDIDSEPLAVSVVNKLRGVIKACLVRAPGFGDKRTLMLEDLAIITGGKVLSKEKGHRLDKLNTSNPDFESYLGKAKIVTVSRDKTTIVDGKGDSKLIEARAFEIKEQYDKEQSFYEKEQLQERLGKLVGGVALVKVGGNSELEIKEKKDRVEDALFATKAALDEGVIRGGGIALYEASREITFDQSDDHGVNIGKKIIQKACRAPFIKILQNVGIDDWQQIYTEIQSAGSYACYDAKKGTVESDAFEAGLIDPTKVVRIALQNASSVAGTILTTESVIYEKEEEGKASVDPMQGVGY